MGLARNEPAVALLQKQGAAALRGDLDDLDTLRRGAQEADAVLHLANKHDWANPSESNRAERAAVEALANALIGSDKAFVLASGLLRPDTSRPAFETDTSPAVGPESLRGGSENLALDYATQGVRSVALRFAPSVHGAGDHGFIAQLVAAAQRTGVSGYVGDGTHAWAAVHRTDAAHLARLALEQATPGARLHAVAEEGVPTRVIAEAIAAGARVVLACGGIGGLYKNSTNFPHITGDAIAMALRHGVACEHLDYIQIHPTTLYSHRKGRRFLISESVRGEGALLLDKNGNRFTNELQPRDVVSAAIRAQMEKDGTDHVWEDMRPIGEAAIREHFPNILERCEEEGYDPIHEPIPVVPAQHYFMGGITADLSSRTALPRLYACGETCCNGVHGRNRLASNSLLESLVFAQRAADDILYGEPPVFTGDKPDLAPYREQEPLFAAYRQEVLTAIERSKNHE